MYMYMHMCTCTRTAGAWVHVGPRCGAIRLNCWAHAHTLQLCQPAKLKCRAHISHAGIILIVASIVVMKLGRMACV